jgi:GNAT superfamily N-acetyltransferase
MLARVREDVAMGRRPQPAFAIRSMTEDDVGEVVALHRECYPDAFLTVLGPRLLCTVYESYATSPAGVSLVAVAEGRIVAAVNGVIGEGFVRDLVRSHPLLVAFGIARALVAQPALLRAFVRRARSLMSRPRGERKAGARRRFVWRSQAVAPSWRGGGLIFPLIKRMIQELEARGVEEIYSTPDMDNQAATWIHRVLGFRRVGERLGENGRMQAVYVLPLGGARGIGAQAN